MAALQDDDVQRASPSTYLIDCDIYTGPWNKAIYATVQVDNMTSIKNLYLLGYNGACAAGWAYVLFVCVKHLAGDKGDPQAVYDDVEKVLQIVQTAAIMEVSGSDFSCFCCCRCFYFALTIGRENTGCTAAAARGYMTNDTHLEGTSTPVGWFLISSRNTRSTVQHRTLRVGLISSELEVVASIWGRYLHAKQISDQCDIPPSQANLHIFYNNWFQLFFVFSHDSWTDSRAGRV